MEICMRDLTLNEIREVSGGTDEIVVTARRLPGPGPVIVERAEIASFMSWLLAQFESVISVGEPVNMPARSGGGIRG
jgi:hypothetical protein